MEASHIRPRPTIYGHARMYVAGVLALADLLGIEPITVLTKHRDVATTVFVQACKDGVWLDSGVQLPKIYRHVEHTGSWREEKAS